ncbi:MAG: HAMP domain-containing sensor histidine kinase [Bacteroidota bacterium]|nr:HAMP domain-containing sensor histidine kinase [Bacteroidota bacterium]
MSIYTKKKRWKLILFTVAIVIVAASLWYTNILVNMISRDERANIQVWADAIQQKAELVNYTDKFFRQIQTEERKRAEILLDAYHNINRVESSNELEFYFKIIAGNTTVPIIITDKNDSILMAKNNDYINFDSVFILNGQLKREYTQIEPLRIRYFADKYYILYYKESIIYTELRQVLDNLIESFFSEVVSNSASVPVIITDSVRQEIFEYGNLDTTRMKDSLSLQNTIEDMAAENDPIMIDLVSQGKKYIYYQDSALLTQLIYYPYIQFSIIGLFFMIAYFLFSTARRSEQNQVWVGMSKETAHQLGTPLSSIMAWIELLRQQENRAETIDEIEKDVIRLQSITDRFSKIGSTPRLEPTQIYEVVNAGIGYIKNRASKKVTFTVNQPENKELLVPLNEVLFTWVIENICKNALDAMGGSGKMRVDITEDEKLVHIDFSDTGKGIAKSDHKTIFNPGVTSKKRGWGLGLSLSKRIIKEYHKGKIFVLSSSPEKGTTFRISLRK